MSESQSCACLPLRNSNPTLFLYFLYLKVTQRALEKFKIRFKSKTNTFIFKKRKKNMKQTYRKGKILPYSYDLKWKMILKC